MPVNSAFSALCSTEPTDEIARRDIQMKFSQPREHTSVDKRNTKTFQNICADYKANFICLCANTSICMYYIRQAIGFTVNWIKN